MTRLAAIALLATGLAGCSDAPEEKGNTYQLYFLGGQSNMEGFGFVEQLPAEMAQSPGNVAIFHGRTVADGEDGGGIGYWAPPQPGHGFEFDTDGKSNQLSGRFGPEMSFAHTMARSSPGTNIALVKYTRGGTALVDGVSGFGSWDPDYRTGNARNQLDNALTAIEEATKPRDIDGAGHIDRLVPAGIAWMQGEADAFDNEQASSEYAKNLSRIVGIFRESLGAPDLPIAIGRIRDSGDTAETRVMAFSPKVREQQAQFVNADKCAALVTASDNFSFLPDGWHYTSADYVALGRAFARALTDLQETCQ